MVVLLSGGGGGGRIAAVPPAGAGTKRPPRGGKVDFWPVRTPARVPSIIIVLIVCC